MTIALYLSVEDQNQLTENIWFNTSSASDYITQGVDEFRLVKNLHQSKTPSSIKVLLFVFIVLFLVVFFLLIFIRKWILLSRLINEKLRRKRRWLSRNSLIFLQRTENRSWKRLNRRTSSVIDQSSYFQEFSKLFADDDKQGYHRSVFICHPRSKCQW